MKFVQFGLFVLLLLSAVFPAFAQTPIDLTTVNTLLDQAETSLAGNDLTTAQALLTSASVLITEDMTAACAVLTSAKDLLDQAATAADVTTAQSLMVGARALIDQCGGSQATATPTSGDSTDPDVVLAALGITDSGNEIVPPYNLGAPAIVGTTGDRSSWTSVLGNITDFVLHTTITWGDPSDFCVVGFRDNQQQPYNAYQVHINTLQDVYFRYIASDARIYDRISKNSGLNVMPQSTNQLVIVGNGDTFTIYINDLKNPIAVYKDVAYPDGGIALGAWRPASNTSQNPSCAYDDVWVWQPDTTLTLPLPQSVSNSLTALGQSGELVELVSEVPAIPLNPISNGVYGEYRLQSNNVDFVFSTNIVWGDADDECQIYFRDSYTGNAYQFVIRPNGTAYFQEVNNGVFSGYFEQITPELDTSPNAVNHITLVVQGNVFSVYINQEYVFDYTDSNSTISTGTVRFSVWSSVNTSQATSCTFSDAWIVKL